MTTGQAVAIVTIPVATIGAIFLGYETLKHFGILGGAVPPPPGVAPGALPGQVYGAAVTPPLVPGSNAAQVAGIAQSITGDVTGLAGAFTSIFGAVGS